ncbi:MAG: methylmalonyl Co-A mutase-associated GTPase MeaB [Deinococcales bacterium]
MEDLLKRLRDGEERALARAISLVESSSDAGEELLRGVRAHTGGARIVGITGAPGSGKSTLADGLIAAARAQGRRVGVVAVDPTSPFSGGAILGDRIRMTRWHDDREVFIRSMATRGHLGGLAAATLQVLAVLDAAGFDTLLVETVGVGQSEVDIVRVADTTVLVLTPNAGDAVQTFKAGIMEIADVFCINKYDLPGGDRLKREIRAALQLGAFPEGSWRPPIVEAIASRGEGSEAVLAQAEAHREHLARSGELEELRRRRVRFELLAIVGEQLRLALGTREDEAVDAVLAGKTTPREVVRRLLAERPQRADALLESE